MKIIIASSHEEVGRVAARLVARRITMHRRHGRAVGLRLATGGTPRPLYRELVRLHREEAFAFGDVWFSSLDAYVGPKRGDLGSYPDELWEQLLRHVDCDPEKVRLTDAPTDSPDELLAIIHRLEQELDEPERHEIALFGIGHDTHVAFICPGSRRGRLRLRGFGIEQLSELTREKNARFFGCMKELVPPQALTILGGSLLGMDLNILMAAGEEKADAVWNMLHQPVCEEYPATILREAPRTVVILDRAAARRIAR